MTKSRENQVNVTLKPDTRKRIESFMARYYKRDKAQVVWEIVEQYIDKYEEAEEGKFQRLHAQGVLGKESAPATMAGRRARKSA